VCRASLGEALSDIGRGSRFLAFGGNDGGELRRAGTIEWCHAAFFRDCGGFDIEISHHALRHRGGRRGQAYCRAQGHAAHGPTPTYVAQIPLLPSHPKPRSISRAHADYKIE
jgi:hypothetical protein